MEHALAFAMGTHGRLGGGVWLAAAAAAGGARRSSQLQGKAASPIFRLKEELMEMIVRLSAAWPAGRAGDEEGAVRLMGGGAGAGRAMRAWPAMAMQVVMFITNAGREVVAGGEGGGGSGICRVKL